MKAEDKPAFAELLVNALAFWKQDVSTFGLTVWWEACRAFDLEQVTKSLSAHAVCPDRGRFAPMPADIVRLLQGTAVDRSLLAWGKVSDAMGSVGAYDSVCFDDPAIHSAIVDMGGWPSLCRGSFDELSHTQRRFCELHRAYSARGGDEYSSYLVGVFESTNRLEGRLVKPPKLIGDPQKALRIMDGGLANGKTLVTTQVTPTLAFGGEAP
jgi:Domain of unknown function (DUF6475)